MGIDRFVSIKIKHLVLKSRKKRREREKKKRRRRKGRRKKRKKRRKEENRTSFPVVLKIDAEGLSKCVAYFIYFLWEN